MNKLKVFYSSYINPYVDAFWELLYPQGLNCISCKAPLRGDEKYSLCSSCFSKIHFYDKGRWIQIDSIEEGAFLRIYSPTEYSDITKRIVAKFKYNNETYLARVMAEIMMDYIYKEDIYFTTIAAVPLHPSKIRRRGFNQAYLLADHISILCNIPNIKEGLIRNKNTTAMHLLSKDERRKNVNNAFEVRRPQEFFNQHVLLIDDIVTTGATLEACFRMLLEAKAASVTAITFARRTKEEG